MGFYQIPVRENSREKLSVTTTAGTFRPTVLLFATNCSAAIFQQTMVEILGDILGKDLASIYIDDLCLGYVTFAEHLEALETVFQRLRAANLTLNIKKCKFAANKVKLSGFVIDESGIHQDPAKTRAITEYPLPVTVNDVLSFVGMVLLYRIFIL